MVVVSLHMTLIYLLERSDFVRAWVSNLELIGLCWSIDHILHGGGAVVPSASKGKPMLTIIAIWFWWQLLRSLFMHERVT